jgi:Uncharacterized conserved protein (DUF2358)
MAERAGVGVSHRRERAVPACTSCPRALLPARRRSRALQRVHAEVQKIFGTKFHRNLSSLMKTLQDDSPNLFSEQGMDLSVYADHVDFQDPITRYDDIQVR